MNLELSNLLSQMNLVKTYRLGSQHVLQYGINIYKESRNEISFKQSDFSVSIPDKLTALYNLEEKGIKFTIKPGFTFQSPVYPVESFQLTVLLDWLYYIYEVE